MELYESVKRSLLHQDMIREGDRVIAGVSGGADSVCLFLLLDQLRSELPFTLSVLHVEHGIRGESSKEDAAFVEQLAAEHGVPCRVVTVDAPEYAKAQGLSLEEAARDLRYRAFYEAGRAAEKETDGRVRIAVAHHRDDQAETMLFHLIRGSALRGLAGMRPVSDMLIRPLLSVSREEIEAYLREQGASFREDESNRDIRFSRNRLRLQVLPELEEIVNGAGAHIAEAAEELGEVYEYLFAEVKAASERIITREPQLLIRKEEFQKFQPLIRRYVIFEALGEACGSRKDIEREHVEAVMALMDNQSGRQLSLPYDVNAQRTYQGIRLVRLHTGAKKETYHKTEEELRKLIRTRIFPAPEKPEIPKKKYTKWLDYDKIKNILQIRTRKAGDYLWVTDDGAKKSLKKYFIDEKIPGEERAFLPLLCDGDHVVWVIGYRVSAYYKVTAETKRIIEVTYTAR